MFQALATLIKDSGLRGVDLTVRPVGEDGSAMSIMLSFNQKNDFEAKLVNDHQDKTVNANADSVVALRAALNTPLAIICKPDEVIDKVEHALTQLREGVISAATGYSELDISALLTKAANAAKTANAAKAATAKAPASSTAPDAKAGNTKKTTAPAKAEKPTPEQSNAPDKTDAPAKTVTVSDNAAEPVKDAPKGNDFSDFDSL